MKACLFSGLGNYQEMEESLSLFVAQFEFTREVRPDTMYGRSWHLYVCDTVGMRPLDEIVVLEEVAKMVRLWPKKAICIWSEATWDRFKQIDPEAAALPNCLRCDVPGWVEKMTINVKRIKRQHRGL